MDKKFLFCGIILLLATSTYADILCWTSEDTYISRHGPQMSKFCSCASGIYGYTSSYKAFADYAETTQFVDYGDNTNWAKKPKSVEYYPVKYITCLDGVRYYTNETYYTSVTQTTTTIPQITCQQKCQQIEYSTWACEFLPPAWAEESMIGEFCPGGETCWCGNSGTTTTIPSTIPTTTTIPTTNGETLISEWIYGVSESVSSYGNRIYLNAGDVLIVMDATDPNNLIKLTEIQNAGLTIGGGPQTGQYITSNDKIIAICQGERGATIVDANTFTTTKLEFESSVNSAYITGNTLFLSVGGKLVVVDVTLPSNPAIVSSTDIPCNNMASEGNYLYVVNDDQVDIYSISDLNTLVSSYPCGGTIWDIVVLNDVVYVARHFEGVGYHSVHFIDVSVKNTPTALGTYVSPSGNSYKKIVVMNDNYLIVTEHDRFVEIVDTSNKLSPTRIATVDYTHGYPRDVCKVDATHFALASSMRGLDIFDFSNPLNVIKTNYPVAYGRIKGGVMDQDTKIGYLLDDLGLRIIDFNTYIPVQLTYFDFRSRGSEIKLVDDIAYCAVTWGGMKIVGVSDPNNPLMLTDYNPSEYINNIQLIGNYAYMDHFSSIRLFDITDKTSIVELSSSQLFGKRFWGWTVQDGYLYVANWDDGLLIYDWSDKNSPPVFISQTQCDITQGSGIVVDGNIAYVQDYYYGLRICDVTNKQAPVHIGDYTEYHINPRGAGMEKYGNILYFGTSYGTYKLDVIDPTNPTKISNVGSGSPCSIDGNLLSMCRGAEGFALYQIGGVVPTTTTLPPTTTTTIPTTTLPTTTTTLPTTTTTLPTTTTTLPPTPPQPNYLPHAIGISVILIIIGGILYFKN